MYSYFFETLPFPYLSLFVFLKTMQIAVFRTLHYIQCIQQHNTTLHSTTLYNTLLQSPKHHWKALNGPSQHYRKIKQYTSKVQHRLKQQSTVILSTAQYSTLEMSGSVDFSDKGSWAESISRANIHCSLRKHPIHYLMLFPQSPLSYLKINESSL